MSHQNLVNYTVVARIKQYSSHTVLAKTGFDKVGHRWAWRKFRSTTSLVEPRFQLRALEGNIEPEDNLPT